MTNPYVVRGGIQARVGNGAAGAAHGAAEAATEDPEIFFYEFMGTLNKYDRPDLVMEDGEHTA
jgi:hypothetical protein